MGLAINRCAVEAFGVVGTLITHSNARSFHPDTTFTLLRAYLVACGLPSCSPTSKAGGKAMHLDEREAGPYRIYTGAIQRGDRFLAGVAVIYAPDLGSPTKDVFVDEALFDGRLFDSPDEALTHAMNVGDDIVRRLDRDSMERT